MQINKIIKIEKDNIYITHDKGEEYFFLVSKTSDGLAIADKELYKIKDLENIIKALQKLKIEVDMNKELVSNCCSAPATNAGEGETELCSACHEGCEIIDINKEE